MSRIQRILNALRRCRRRALMYTTPAPARLAARSWAVRPALSKITRSGRQRSMSATTAAEWKVGDDASSVAGKGVSAAYGASRLKMN